MSVLLPMECEQRFKILNEYQDILVTSSSDLYWTHCQSTASDTYILDITIQLANQCLLSCQCVFVWTTASCGFYKGTG